jgi:hypothetical protein
VSADAALAEQVMAADRQHRNHQIEGRRGLPVITPRRRTIIVWRRPVSRETNYRTEFVAVLNNQPRGDFLMRRPTVAVPVASGNFWTSGATTASASFSRAIGTPNLPMRVRAPANTINRYNSAGGKTRHAARRPYRRSRLNLRVYWEFAAR